MTHRDETAAHEPPMQKISDANLAAHEDITMSGNADDSYVQAIVEDLRAARRTLALIRLRNGIDMLASEEGEFEMGILHSATFVQEILDDEMRADDVAQLVRAATAQGVEVPEALVALS